MHFLLAWTAPQRYAEHAEIIGIGAQEVAEILARAQQLDKDFQSACPPLQERRQMLGADGLSEETFEVIEGHVGIGTIRQQPVKKRRQLAQAVLADGLGQMGQIAPATLLIAHTPGGQE